MSDAAFTATIPRLTTERLLLREFRKTDFDVYAENMADTESTTFLGGVVDRRTAWRFFIAGGGAWVINGAGWWAVELRTTGEFVGTVGAFFRESPIGPPLGDRPDLELGWTIWKPYWRKGYAREAAARALAYGFERHPIEHAVAIIDKGNDASVSVSKAIGMRHDREVDFYGHPTERYVIDRSGHAAASLQAR